MIIVAFRRFAGERAARPCLLQSSADIRPGGETVRREFSHLTDRELADIGITRSDIERIASGEAHS